MPSVADLRARTGAQPAYVLFIEGLEYAFTDEPELEGTAWIGTEHGPRTVLGGLRPSIASTERVEIRDSGLLETGEATFELIDQDHTTLVNLFGTQRDTSTLYQLGERLSPREKRINREYAAWGGGPDIDLRNKFVGLERIGPDGERGWFWILPVHKRDRLRRDHPVTEYSDTDQDNNLPPVFVSEEPIQFAGRGVALFEVYKDDDGTWKSWEECYEGGGLWFYGKLLDEGELSSVRTWSLQAAGFSAWLRKPLNSGKPDRGYPLQGKVSLTPGQRGIAVWFTQFGESGAGFGGSTHDGMMFETDFGSSDDTPAELLTHVKDQVDKALNGGTGHTSGAAGPYADDPNNAAGSDRWASFHDDSVIIRVDVESPENMGQMWACMHEIVWRALSWDPEFQRQLPPDDQRRVQFTPVVGQSFKPYGGITGKQYLGSDGYWIAEFRTSALNEAYSPDNNGGDRKYSAAYQGGAYSLRASGRQEVKIGVGLGPYVEGINARRPADGAAVDGETCTDVGYWLFTGVRRTDPEEEDGEEYAQVALCSWVTDSGGRIQSDGDGDASIFIEKWCDPRVWGIEHDKLEGDWAFSVAQEEQLLAYPLGVIGGAAPDEPDNAFWAIGRMLVSTGTGYGNGSNSNPTYVEGTNGIPYSKPPQNGYFGDFETYDMSLGIPYEHVDIGSLRRLNDAMPGPGLQRSRYALLGAIDSEDLLRQFMSSRGLAMGLRRGDYGPRLFFWSIYGPWNPDEAVTTINADGGDVVGGVEDARSLIASQGIRWETPVDYWTIEHTADPIEGSMRHERRQKSLDPEARGRHGKVEARASDGGLVADKLWRLPPSWGYWYPDWVALHARQGAEWYAKRHFPITVRIRRTIDVGPGDLVFYTDQLPADTDGTYGLSSRLARVLEVQRQTHSASYEVTLLVQAEPLDRVRYWAPLVRPWGHDSDINSAGEGWVYCAKPGVIHWEHGNWAGHGGTRSDVAGLAEPPWSSTGGTAKVAIDQSFNGKDWGNRVVATVLEVDPVDHRVRIEIVSGVLLRDTEKLMTLLPIDQQDANSWTREVYAPYTDNAGTHDGAAGWRFNG